jgi:hypothetical protein
MKLKKGVWKKEYTFVLIANAVYVILFFVLTQLFSI